VLSFAPDFEDPFVDEMSGDRVECEVGSPAEVPEVHNMRSDLTQLISILEGDPDLADLPVTMEQDVADDLGLEEWLEEDEWEDEDEDEENTETSLDEVDWP
jgi:hypothetical protein